MSAQNWNIDTAHSDIFFTVRHLVITKVRGRFGKWQGTLSLDEQDLSKSQVEVSIDAASIDTNEEKRDGHLRSADFLDTDKFPKLTFKSTKIEAAAGDKLRVTGNLTIRDVTKSVTLDVEKLGKAKDPWGNTPSPSTATSRSSARTSAPSGTRPSRPAASWSASRSTSTSNCKRPRRWPPNPFSVVCGGGRSELGDVMSAARQHLADAHRIVVKLGTHVVAHDGELALERSAASSRAWRGCAAPGARCCWCRAARSGWGCGCSASRSDRARSASGRPAPRWARGTSWGSTRGLRRSA